MPKKPVHTVKNPNGGWDNVQAADVISHHFKKVTAVDKGRQVAKRDETEHRIPNTDGKITQSNSYGNDPKPPKDKR